MTYLIGLLAVALIYSLFYGCWADQATQVPLSKRHSATLGGEPSAGSAATIFRSRAPEWIMAIAAIGALLIYWTQATYMKSSMHVQHRAWVSISNPTKYSVEAGRVPTFKFTMKNLGLTPARVKWYFLRAQTREKWHGFSRDVQIRSPLTENPTVLPPGAAREVSGYEFTEKPLTEAELNEPLFVQFIVVYLDAFDNERVTVGCYTYHIEKDIWTEFGLDNAQRME